MRKLCFEIRKIIKEISLKSGVDIEPDSQTKLLNKLME